jgi:hypothetical protein
MIMAGILLSETMVNKSSDEEPAFKFFVSKFSDIRELIKRAFLQIKESTTKPDVSPDQYFFYLELLETFIYAVLDFCINETASATNLQISFPIPKQEAKLLLSLGNAML